VDRCGLRHVRPECTEYDAGDNRQDPVTAAHDDCGEVARVGCDPSGTRTYGRSVELPHVAVVGFENVRIAYERIYRDQDSMLVQLGLLDVDRLPLVGSRHAAALLHKDYARNELITG
jgi:hypothetical protein